MVASECGRHIRMSENFGQGFYIKSGFNTTGGECMSQSMTCILSDTVSFQKSLKNKKKCEKYAKTY